MPSERLMKRKKSLHIKREDSLSRPTSLVASSEAEGKGKQHRVKKYMFKKPAPLNSWETEEHRSESWFELFIDLFYVAFFIKLGDIFYTCGFTVDTVLHVCAVFLGIYMSKFDFDQYMNKFEGEDLVHKIFFLFYALGNVIMILNVNETSEHAYKESDNDGSSYGYGSFHSGDYELENLASNSRSLAAGSARHVACVAYGPYSFGFSLGWLITRSSIFIMYCLIAHHVKPQGEYLLKSKSPILISSMLIICTNFIIDGKGDNYINTYIIFVAGLVEFFGWMVWEVFIFGTCITKYVGKQVLIPVNIHHITSRTSTFIMLVLGEAVIALLTPTFNGDGNHYFFAIFGVTIIFIFTFLYFDMQPRHHEPNALAIGRYSGVAWVALHPMLAFAMFGIGMSLKLLYADLREHKDPEFSEQLLGGFLGTSVMLMTLIRSSHKMDFTRGRVFTFIVRMILASLHIEVGYIKLLSDNINVTIALHIVICFLLIALDSWKYRHFEANAPTETGSMPVAAVSNRPLARRGSVYAPQRSASKGSASPMVKESKRTSMNLKSSQKRASIFTPGSFSSPPTSFFPNDDPPESPRYGVPSRKHLRRSMSAGVEGAANIEPSLQSRLSLQRMPTHSSAREDKIKEALEGFEKSRPHASIRQVRRSSMFTTETGVMRSSSKDLLLNGGSAYNLDGIVRGTSAVGDEEQKDMATTIRPVGLGDVELTEGVKKPSHGEVITLPQDKPPGQVILGEREVKGGDSDGEEDDEFDVEYVCYVDEQGNVIEVDENGHVIANGMTDSNLDEYDEEIVEVEYEVDSDDDFFDDYDSDEVEIIYEDPDPPKSHITWL